MQVRVYRNGAVASGGSGENPDPPKRGECRGWTQAACRRNTQWLYSVDVAQLGGEGWAFTLTLRDCPPSPESWHRLRGAFVKRLRRLGVVRVHWVTEWQRRGVPHLHGVAYWDSGRAGPVELLRAWLQVADSYRPAPWAQHVIPITDALGWLKYCAKHASRGVGHYQRSRACMPPAWQGASGRVWGHIGAWPCVDPAAAELSRVEWYRLRRMVRGWRLADARRAGSRRRIRSARRMLRCHHQVLSGLRGWSEWIPEPLMLRMLTGVS